jgi:hypothetical protein
VSSWSNSILIVATIIVGLLSRMGEWCRRHSLTSYQHNMRMNLVRNSRRRSNRFISWLLSWMWWQWVLRNCWRGVVSMRDYWGMTQWFICQKIYTHPYNFIRIIPVIWEYGRVTYSLVDRLLVQTNTTMIMGTGVRITKVTMLVSTMCMCQWNRIY